jgi:acid-sensing ion channel, other
LQFPTVTVCPLDPFATDGNQTYDYDDSKDQYLQLIETLKSEIISEEYERNNGQSSLREVVFNIAIKCEELFNDCKFRGNDIPCCNIFKPIYSERGFCFSFNAQYFGNNE